VARQYDSLVDGSPVVVHRNGNASHAARAYAIRELGRRAGARTDWIASWRVSFEPDRTVLFPQTGSNARIVFPVSGTPDSRTDAPTPRSHARFTWMQPPSSNIEETVPDFIVYAQPHGDRVMPLFWAQDAQEIGCNADILAATVSSLARSEELNAHRGDLDEHARFPARSAAAWRSGTLERPHVDEYGLALRQALTYLLPSWTPEPARLRAKLSHDMDILGLPRSLRATVGHLYPRRLPSAFLRDAASLAGFGPPAYLQAVFDTAQLSRERGLDSAFYWTCSTASTPWDTGYDIDDARIRRVVETLAAQGFEIGLHPAYDTFGSFARLQDEVWRLRRIAGAGPIGGRQHFLRWRPRTWHDWERVGLAYDSSVGYADSIGFRAGTAWPYHPWLVDEARESTLLEIPLLVMDCTLIGYMNLSPDDAVARVAAMLERCKAAGGVFTVLWHNDKVIERPYAALYRRILNLLAGLRGYDWRADLPVAALPQSVVERAAR
jgi:hypothetical protein